MTCKNRTRMMARRIEPLGTCDGWGGHQVDWQCSWRNFPLNLAWLKHNAGNQRRTISIEAGQTDLNWRIWPESLGVLYVVEHVNSRNDDCVVMRSEWKLRAIGCAYLSNICSPSSIEYLQQHIAVWACDRALVKSGKRRWCRVPGSMSIQ